MEFASIVKINLSSGVLLPLEISAVNGEFCLMPAAITLPDAEIYLIKVGNWIRTRIPFV